MQTLGKMVGTIGWTAPELMFGENFTAKSDVYSVGIIIWVKKNYRLIFLNKY